MNRKILKEGKMFLWNLDFSVHEGNTSDASMCVCMHQPAAFKPRRKDKPSISLTSATVSAKGEDKIYRPNAITGK